MTYFQSICLIIFGILLYLILVDQSISFLVNLLPKILKNEIQKKIWLIKMHPRNPITNLIKRWEYDRIAKELEKEFNSKEK